jgi:hypothetical protein
LRCETVAVWILIALPCPAAAQGPLSVEASAARFVPAVKWRAASVVTGDFSCRGHKETAILGTNQSDTVIAIFLSGTGKPPEVLRYSAKSRRTESAALSIESMDFEPRELANAIESAPEGLRPSKTCKGLRLDDGYTDPAHIYWNHRAHRFADWTL